MSKQPTNPISTVIAFALLPLSGFATDIYIPSMPSMASALHITDAQVQLTLTVFLISYGLSQLFVGSLLDSFGRYKIGLVSLFIFSIASLTIALSTNLYVICAMRIIHGITAALIIVAKRAYFVDVFEGERLKHYLSLFTIIWSVGPIVAPFIGGYLEQFFGWQSNFYLLAGLSFVLLILDWIFSRETLLKPIDFNLKTIISIYLIMLKTKPFLLGIVMLSLAYSAVMVYNMTGPFIIEHQFHLNSVVAGYCSLILGFAWMLGGLIGRATIRLPFHDRMRGNIIIQTLFVLAMIGVGIWVQSLPVMIFFAFLIQACTGYTYNNYFTYCLSRFPNYAGMSGGMTGGIVYILVSIFSYRIVTLLPPKDSHNLSLSYLVLVLLSGVVMAYLYRLNTTKAKEELSTT
ncbi:MFS transporter [Siphonobacter sp. SORGH_AS_0500]|uniref:MFS transporter n=1 Tax=Siphonobacter sp. SORGH_AS_0500 TaxID=1864824 RepID=UPI002866DED3|nr:MFS transporter [Siphonobacter sp. SORGH_AS_0500]MDR6197608.1 multidrug resistance protein [Siphonobacter sp. SORGH_AS_0500]